MYMNMSKLFQRTDIFVRLAANRAAPAVSILKPYLLGIKKTNRRDEKIIKLASSLIFQHFK